MRDYYMLARVAYFSKKLRFKPEVMEDILQETVLKLWEFDDGTYDEALLQYKAKYLVIDAVREVLGDSRNKNKLNTVSIDSFPKSRLIPDTSTVLEERQILDSITREYCYMKPNEAKIIDACINDKSMRQLAKELDRTEASVSLRLKGLKERITKLILGG